MTVKEADIKMINFFRKLADNLENENLSKEDSMRAGQMFMFYKFHEEHYLNDLSGEDYMKYLITGWYIHTEVENINRINDDIQMSSKLNTSVLSTSSEKTNPLSPETEI